MVPFVSHSGEESGSVPCFGFEGFEKRLEVQFSHDVSNSDLDQTNLGLRALLREDIDRILKEAECTIVSQLSNEFVDSYVLSESSLFVYHDCIVMKTCGTTQLLRGIPPLLEACSRLRMRAKRCKYSRGNFIFPAAQPFPHNSFNEEVNYLEKYFGHLGGGGKSFVMGDASKSGNWHIYCAAAETDAEAVMSSEAMWTVEMCMTELNREAASQFYKSVHASAADMTKASGISQIMPDTEICDFAFDPCGYSMNGVEGAAHSTIHVTPEEGFSYASFEAMGYGPPNLNLQALVDKVLLTFKPGEFSLAFYVSHLPGYTEEASFPCSLGYFCQSRSKEEFHNSAIIFHTYRRKATPASAISASSLFKKGWLTQDVDDLDNMEFKNVLKAKMDGGDCRPCIQAH